MKKFIITMVFAIGLSFQAEASYKNQNIISVNQEKTYNPIEASAIPAEVLKNISSKYGGFTIREAYVAADGEYKLVLAKDETTTTAYFNSKGEFIKEA
ncbi:hypothetical protein GV828_00215 [Flavobacterium sp. NST-5]|uniref:Beta-lactamase-inhibitor-like PepSY-like domain-containing protein n=1 Tax=Flavobacterium ichthyis TaxID=2698827 RepID=A0ABW9Z458_9FLAO|nr:hypothetical protein [Flavobacterium ichthyis]NBL63621.1 hypothetical protein [Flavobacterium ichthyis]